MTEDLPNTEQLREEVNAPSTDLNSSERAEEQLFRMLVEKAQVGLYVIQDGKAIYANPAVAELFGYTPAELSRLDSWVAIVAEEDRPRVHEYARHCLAGEAPAEGHFTFHGRRKDGSRVEVEIRGCRTEFRGRPAVFGTLLDATAHQQLLHAQKLEAVGRLAGGIAHDFNNLMTIVTGYCELALGSLTTDHPAAEMIREIARAGARAAGLTRQLLAFARRQLLQPRVLDLNAMLRDLAPKLRPALAPGVDLVVRLDPALGRVKVDPAHFEEVLLSLAIIARDAMPAGGRLTLETGNIELDERWARARPEVQPGSHVTLAVTDTGQGMTEEVKARLFEPFFTTKEFGKRTGLGLATVYGIVKQSGGHIEIESAPGRGTTFRIYLTRTTEPADVMGG